MSIHSIKIKNLLSFNETIIQEFNDINCLVGKNNVGKSNLLKLIQYFYDKLNNKKSLAPHLHSNYSYFGEITVTYNLSRIKKIVTSRKNFPKSTLFSPIFNKFFNPFTNDVPGLSRDRKLYSLTLKVYSDESIAWSTKDKEILKFLSYLYPFFYIDTRHINLHDWSDIWTMVGSIKSVSSTAIPEDDIIKFFDTTLSTNYFNKKSNFFRDNINKIEMITNGHKLNFKEYKYKEKVINYIKSSLKGDSFLIDDKDISFQSDGTSSSSYIQIFLALFIALSRREYIEPIVFIDEPEIGLHPKKAEDLVYQLFKTYQFFKKDKNPSLYPQCKYNTPSPKIIFSTHSSNIVKMIIKLFEDKQQVLHLSKDKHTKISKLKSTYNDPTFLHRFTDNEARLFFSEQILFVEGETELELFGNKELVSIFPYLEGLDIFQTADFKKIKHINPSYTKSDIPYYILYDIDKIYHLKHKDNKLELKNDFFNFKFYYEKQRKTFPNYKYNGKKYPIKYNLINILTNNNINHIKYTTIDNILLDKIFFDQQYMLRDLKVKDKIPYTFYFSLLFQFLLLENHLVTKTTTENILINEDSLSSFMNWIYHEIKNHTYIKEVPDSDLPHLYKKWDMHSKTYKNYIKVKYNVFKHRRKNHMPIPAKKNKIHMSNRTRFKTMSNDKHFSKLYTYSFQSNSADYNISEESFSHQNYYKKVKEKKLLDLQNTIQNIHLTFDKNKAPFLFILLFNGKTQTLFKKSQIDQVTDKRFVNMYKQLNTLLDPLKVLYGEKTSNWVSLYLNFIIKNIKKDCLEQITKPSECKEQRKKEQLYQSCLEDEFNSLFKELGSIINVIKS